jgi:hypothetical protein
LRAARLCRSAARVAVRRRCSSPRLALKERGSALRPCLLLSGILGFGEYDQRARQFFGAEGVGAGLDDQLRRALVASKGMAPYTPEAVTLASRQAAWNGSVRLLASYLGESCL